ncbi:tail protein X [Viridibacillus sp. FSL R5-0468]|uniref:tail protein X n=1 Tax=Viridibacillus sp. FSL R5-0468 TaxID=2921640 RepID=UPI0030FC3F50
MNSYITNQGDMWDLIAFKTLGSEYLLPFLLQANKQYRDVYIFSQGINIVIPDVETDNETDRPEWLGEIDDD